MVLLPWVKAKHINGSENSLDSFGYQISYYLPYSVDLTSSDLHLFLCLKHQLSDNHYNDKRVVKTARTFWLSEQKASFFDDDTQNSVVR